MDIYLIRHSITDANSASTGYAIMCGSTQAHVTDKGIELAENEKSPFVVVSSSTILRLMLTIIMEMPLNKFHDIAMDNCNVIHLKYSGNGKFMVI